MTRMTAFATIVLLITFSVSGWAQGNQNLADENAQPKNSLWSSLDIQLYGFLKVDAAYDNSRTTTGNYILYVDPDTGKHHDDEFNLTANETRLGVLINGPEDGRMKTSGRVEFDFYGSLAAENKAKIQLRHAYVQMEWPDRDLTLLAGQTWDVISPLIPTTLNYTVLWDVGNIGYRRPQVRLTKDHQLNDEVSLKFEGAISRTIGRLDATVSESGEDAGFPTVQGRVAVTFPWLLAGDTTIGVSGHRGREEYDTSATTNVDHDTWSINVDLVQPIRSWVTLKAEAFTGENLSSYLGGIGQGVNNATNKEISSKGGWAAASFGPWDDWSFTAGISIDDVDSDDMVGDTRGRTLNRAVFANAIRTLNEHASVGFELSQWRTDYKGSGDADDVRLQAAVKYKF